MMWKGRLYTIRERVEDRRVPNARHDHKCQAVELYRFKERGGSEEMLIE
jgi:hypothetical protein